MVGAPACAQNRTTIQQCLDSYLKGETFECRCQHCSGTQSVRHSSVIQTPEILVLALEWFGRFDGLAGSELAADARYGYPRMKTSRQLVQYTSIQVPVRVPDGTIQVKYGLHGIVFHSGPDNAGHFKVVGRSSACVSGQCSGMVNGMRTCDAHGWRVFNDASVSDPTGFNDAIRQVTSVRSSDPPLGDDRHPVLSCTDVTPTMLFYTRLADGNGSNAPSVPCCALCTRGDTWRTSI